MTHAEVSARRQELLIPKIAQRIMDARTPEVAEALAVEIIETIKFVERAATMVAETAARRAPKRHKQV